MSPEQFKKVIETLDATAAGQQIAIAWIAKEKLRDALNLRARVAETASPNSRPATPTTAATPQPEQHKE